MVWNPGAERSAALPDMLPDDYRHMLCVEAAQVSKAVELAPGETWHGAQILEA
jgi:glucose-6-phosphate 1-epimerase